MAVVEPLLSFCCDGVSFSGSEKTTLFADSLRARGTHTISRIKTRLDDSRLAGLQHARFNQRFLRLERDNLGDWEYRRGTQLQALYSFDVRKVPTTVTITTEGEHPAKVHCSILVKSWLQFTTPGDPRRVEEQIELLEAYVKGSL